MWNTLRYFDIRHSLFVIRYFAVGRLETLDSTQHVR